MTDKPKLTLEQYKPNDVSDIVFGNKDSEEIIKMITSGEYPMPSSGNTGILLYGSNGTGKSSLAKLLPSAIESIQTGNPAHTYEEQCGNGDSGVALLQRIDSRTDFASSNSSGLNYIILDEVDRLSSTAMGNLKVLMNKKLCLFIMTTNFREKIERGVIDRSILVEMNQAPAEKWLPFAHRMLNNASLPHPEDIVLTRIIKSCNGSARKITESLYRLCLEISKKNRIKGVAHDA